LGWTVIGTFVVGILKKIPEIIQAQKAGKQSNLAEVLGIPMENDLFDLCQRHFLSINT
jgi:hypothetical protein